MQKGIQKSKATKQNKVRGTLALLLLSLFCLTGCGKKEAGDTTGTGISPGPTVTKEAALTPLPTATPTPTLVPTSTPTPTPSPTPTPDPYLGKKQSMLTGEWIPEETLEKRPYAVMLNNIKVASPQSGVGDADILYEILAEAGITRLMGIYSEIDPESATAERLGSVRSARHYFVSIADEYDAIFIHFGETTYATKKMKSLGIDHITGMYGIGVSSFYRDNTIKAPHNAFASLKGIETAIKKGDIRTEYEEGYESHFTFYKEDTDLAAVIPEEETDKENGVSVTAVNKVTLGFSTYTSPYFVYDAEKKLYLRYQFDAPHTDYNTGEQLAFKNIIVQFVKEWNIDKNGYQTMEIEEAEGEGYYITNGSMIPITWQKSESKRWMRYFTVDGEELTINPGKTFIAVFPNHRTQYFTTE